MTTLASKPTPGPLGATSGAIEELVRLRWLAIGAQIVAVLVAHWALELEIELGWIGVVLSVAALSNVVLMWRARAHTADEAWVGPILLLDTLLLTCLLQLSGEASNPFSIVYLVQITLAAVRVSMRWISAITVGSILGYGTLFLRAPSSAHAGHEGHAMMDGHGMHGHGMHGMHGAAHEAAFSAHLYGMWLAFAITAVLVAFFVSRVAQALTEERSRADKAARLIAVSTLAAGAAHELSTPLGTIKLAAGELARAIDEGASLENLKADAALIRAEVDRMSEVLGRLRSRSGEAEGEAPTQFSMDALRGDVEAQIESGRERVTFRVNEAELTLPRRAVASAVLNLIKNALDASPDGAVEVELALREGRFLVSVSDRGKGIAAEIEDHLGEPFVTTKEPGRGMGLGLFLVRSLAESLAGSLHLRAREGGGALAELELPVSAK